MVIGLVGRTLGQPGIGNIGAEVFRMARRLDKAFIARDPYADPASAAGLGVELVSIEDLFRRSDFLSASCPLDDETRGIVSACLLGEMKPTAFLINTARGPVLDRASRGLEEERQRRCRPRCLRGRADRGRRGPCRTRQCHPHAAFSVLGRPVLRRKRHCRRAHCPCRQAGREIRRTCQ